MQQSTVSRLDETIAPLIPAIQQALHQCTADRDGCPSRLSAAIRYSVLAPGKRLRPALVLLACEAVSGQWTRAIPAAVAVELMHVYSLIHDDLPCMDNDSLRRGLPTCHIQFDEATAVLAGDSLQMLAIETLCKLLPSEMAVQCCAILAEAAGPSKLVGGQMDDLLAEGRFGQLPDTAGQTAELLQSIHLRKTSALIEASLRMGGVIGGAAPELLGRLGAFGRSLGLAFQIVDDCLDLESTPQQLGKATGKDSRHGKLTYPGLVGLERSRQTAQELAEQACEILSVLGGRSTKLKELARFVIERTH
ncbi:MAG: polyprenyl synthetase family protein [Pirellulaceae bacterium]|nr:polyprenyl synthetase family protein [Pirellulaceae bacterium]